MQAEFWNGKRGPGINDKPNTDNHQNIVDVIDTAFKQHAGNNAFTALGKTMTFGELDLASKNFAAYLQHNTDLKVGDRIAIQMPSVLQYLVVLYGALRAGLVIVNTNPLYTAREMRHQFKDSGARALVYMDMYGDLVEEVLADTDIEYLFESSVADMLPFAKRHIINAVVKYGTKQIPRYSLPQTIRLNKTFSIGSHQEYTKPEISADDIALLQYTGGTTGVAKGAMILHRNLLAQVRQLGASEKAEDRLGRVIGEPGKEILICPLPLYHIYAFSVHCIAALGMGNHSVLITDPRNVKMFIREMKRWPFTAMVGINTLFVSLLESSEFKLLDFSHLKSTFSGGAALNSDTAKRWLEVTGCSITEGYGLTETSPAACTNLLDQQGKPGSIGVPIPGTSLKIIDDQGEELGFDEPGELCIKGPQVMAGYWNKPEASAETIVDGWLKTGDIAQIDSDGFVKIVDRKKDMILVSGFNVFPNEIEDVVSSHPKVEFCACIGIPDKKSGETPKLFVVPKDKSLTVNEINDYCRKQLTAYKRPRTIVFRDQLPMSAVGKVLRKDLRDLE